MAKQSRVMNLFMVVAVLGVVVWLYTNYAQRPTNGAIQNSGTFENENESEPLSGFNDSDFVYNASNASLDNYAKSTTDPRSSNGNINSAPGTTNLVGENNMGLKSTDKSLAGARAASCFPKNQLLATELLPQDKSSTWAQVNPSGTGTLKDRNFLAAGHHIGVNTVGQTLRNANMGLRSEPPCPQVQVSPWMQSTIDPDMGRKPLEIGGCS